MIIACSPTTTTAHHHDGSLQPGWLYLQPRRQASRIDRGRGQGPLRYRARRHIHPVRTMFLSYIAAFDLDADPRDEDEGSIITSLISQLRQVPRCNFPAIHRLTTAPAAHPELAWTFQRSPSPPSCSSPAACLSASPTSCLTPTSFLGKFSMLSAALCPSFI